MKAFVVVIILLSAIQGVTSVVALKKERDSLAKDLSSARSEIALMEGKLASSEAAKDAVREQAQACLKRMNDSLIDAGNWLEIIELSKSRDMEDKEKRMIPDDATRRNLLDSLDRPL